MDIGGYYGFRIVDGTHTQHPQAKKDGGPCLVARYRMDAPYPDVEIVVPMTKTDMFRWTICDPTFTGDLAERLELARRTLLARDEPAVLGTLR